MAASIGISPTLFPLPEVVEISVDQSMTQPSNHPTTQQVVAVAPGRVQSAVEAAALQHAQRQQQADASLVENMLLAEQPDGERGRRVSSI